MNYLQESTSRVLFERRVLQEGEKLDRYRKLKNEPADIEPSAGKVIGWGNCIWTKDLKSFITKHVLNTLLLRDGMGTLFVTSKGLSFRPIRAALESEKNFNKKNIPRDIPLSDINMVVRGNFSKRIKQFMTCSYTIKLNNGHDIAFIARTSKHIGQLDKALDKSQIKVKKSVIKNFTR